MKVLVIGANGAIGTRLVHQLHASERHEPVAMVRKAAQQDKFREQGVTSVLADLEEDIGHAFKNVDAAVFAAGSGAQTGKEKTDLVDRQGAVKAIDTAFEHGVKRFVMVSALGADRNPEQWPDSMRHYYAAKSDADEHLKDSDLNYTILQPGRLTDDAGEGQIRIAKRLDDREGSITRDDVATTIRTLLDQENTYRGTYEMLGGDTAIGTAVDRL